MKEWLKEISGTYFKKVLHEDYIPQKNYII